MYIIVTVEDDMDIVPTNWIVGEEVWLPIKRYGLKFNKMLGNRTKPEEDWTASEAVIHMEYGNIKNKFNLNLINNNI